jgi:hypothetical protein
MVNRVALALASPLPRDFCIPWHAKCYLTKNSVPQGRTASPVHKEQKADDEQYHEKIIVADHGILLFVLLQFLYDTA